MPPNVAELSPDLKPFGALGRGKFGPRSIVWASKTETFADRFEPRSSDQLPRSVGDTCFEQLVLAVVHIFKEFPERLLVGTGTDSARYKSGSRTTERTFSVGGGMVA